MKKHFFFITFFLLVILTSCNKDEDVSPVITSQTSTSVPVASAPAPAIEKSRATWLGQWKSIYATRGRLRYMVVASNGGTTNIKAKFYLLAANTGDEYSIVNLELKGYVVPSTDALVFPKQKIANVWYRGKCDVLNSTSRFLILEKSTTATGNTGWVPHYTQAPGQNYVTLIR